jgi:hypothetical protein
MTLSTFLFRYTIAILFALAGYAVQGIFGGILTAIAILIVIVIIWSIIEEWIQ